MRCYLKKSQIISYVQSLCTFWCFAPLQKRTRSGHVSVELHFDSIHRLFCKHIKNVNSFKNVNLSQGSHLIGRMNQDFNLLVTICNSHDIKK